MKKKTFVSVIFLILIWLFISTFSFGTIPETERAALIDLYNSTNGNNWTNNSGWKTRPLHTDGFAMPGTEGDWKGITVTEGHVTKIEMGSNNLDGSITPFLKNLNNLKYLQLYLNTLTGSIPPELGELKSLEEIWLNNNQLTGAIPSQLGNLSNLKYLRLEENQLTGNIPSQLGNLINLQLLYLAENQLTGPIPKELGNLENLYQLILNDNNLNGSIPLELRNLINLQSLFLEKNQLTGPIPKELGDLTNLSQLLLNDNNLNGTIPYQLGKLKKMIELHLHINALSGSIPAELGDLENLTYIYLHQNNLSGRVPPQLGNLNNLKDLSLHSNKLDGNIPSELGNLENLEYLQLSHNRLSGHIPAELGKLSNLKNIDLLRNNLNGNIPSELGNLCNLEELNLGANKLSGSIPLEFEKLVNLKKLYLNNNKLSGHIPIQFGNLLKLEELSLNDNLLYGNIPTTLTNLTNLKFQKVDLGGNCLLTNNTQLRKWLNMINPGWESQQTKCEETPPLISVNRNSLNIGYIVGRSFKPFEFLTISKIGRGNINWTVDSEFERVTLNPNKGTNAGTVEVIVNPDGLLPAKYEGEIYVIDPLASNSPVQVKINLWVKTNSESSPPFGDFSTPLDNSTVQNSVPVTGWVLGDTGIENVKIYREEGSNLVYIGDANFVEGARPDVEASYPDYPMNYKAGWGYMLLTHFLPNGGNGTFKIHAIATDKEGLTTTLGVKTITVANSTAVKPFGALDFPASGGAASGNKYRNQGWVLTPLPNKILENGSTINVYVDGVYLGHPIYNIYRGDIAQLFPGYTNSNGSHGYFDFDTTLYDNGVHTIYWTASDNAGNMDGIGSRYFMIQNSSSDIYNTGFAGKLQLIRVITKDTLEALPMVYDGPITIKTGYQADQEACMVFPDQDGISTIIIKELERIEIQFPDMPGEISGYMEVGNQLRGLPVGSNLDSQSGIFYWQPGPGFVGNYRLVFIEKKPNGELSRRNISVEILPKHSQ